MATFIRGDTTKSDRSKSDSSKSDPSKSDSGKRRSSKTSVACQACKRRKTKCSGNPPPCEACRKLTTDCVIEPGNDMRRRDSKDSVKPYNLLIDAYVATTMAGDQLLADSLLRALEVLDHTGRLASLAQSRVQYPRSPGATSDDMQAVPPFVRTYSTHHFAAMQEEDPETQIKPGNSPSGFSEIDFRLRPSISNSPEPDISSRCQNCGHNPVFIPQAKHLHDINMVPSNITCCASSNRDPIDHGFDSQLPLSFDDLAAFWATLTIGNSAILHESGASVLRSIDPCNWEPSDTVSGAIISFRNLARQMLAEGTEPMKVIGSATPDLEAFFGLGSDTPAESVWTWSCRFVRAFPALSLAMQMTKLYLSGLLMRFFVHPNSETFEDLPPWLRPMKQQYSVPHAASVDFYQFPILRYHLLLQGGQRDDFIMPKQSCNWSYSDASIFAQHTSPNTITRLSLAFMEHSRNLANHSVDYTILQTVSAMTPHITR